MRGAVQRTHLKCHKPTQSDTARLPSVVGTKVITKRLAVKLLVVAGTFVDNAPAATGGPYIPAP